MDRQLFDGFRSIVRLYDLRDLLGANSKRRVVLCPFPQHQHDSFTPSLSIWVYPDGRQRFKCFGNCGLEGDAIDYMGYMYIPGYCKTDGEHVKMAASLLTQKGTIVEKPIQGYKQATLSAGLWREFIPPGKEAVRYAKKRGLTEETLERFRIGQRHGAISMPTFEYGVLKSIKYRNIRKGNLRFWSEEGSVNSLFNHDNVAYMEDPLLVLTGEIPVMLLAQYGFNACATTGGEGSEILKWAGALITASRIVVVGDNDRDINTSLKTTQKARGRADLLGGELKFPPRRYKDIDEWLLDKPEDVSVVRSWLF